jgi:hypothetical protein
MTAMKLYQNISLAEAAALTVATAGQGVTYLWRGEMGIGKSSMLPDIAAKLPTHVPCYVDCTVKEAGDLLMPSFTEINGMKVVQFVPNSELGLQHGKPLIIMWDEATKAQPAIRLQATRCWQEGQLGDFKLPPGSIQFATGNLLEEGVNDAIQPHQGNRLCQGFIRKPTGEEWRSPEHSGGGSAVSPDDGFVL